MEKVGEERGICVISLLDQTLVLESLFLLSVLCRIEYFLIFSLNDSIGLVLCA